MSDPLRQRPIRLSAVMLIVAMAVLACGLWWWFWNPASSEPAGGGARGSQQPPTGWTVSAPAHAAAVAPPTTLNASAALATPPPPDGTPLAQSFELLAARARAGDSEAAKRLHAEIRRCRLGSKKTVATTTVDLAQVDAAPGNLLELQWLAQRCLSQLLCADTSAAQLRDPTQWMWLAAQAGDQEARLWFAGGMFLTGSQDLDRFAYVPQMQTHGLRWLQEASAQGNRIAYALLAAAYFTPEASAYGGLSELVPYDPVLGLAYELAEQRSRATVNADQVAGLLERGRANLDPAEFVAAQRLAEQLQRAVQPDRGQFMEWMQRLMGTALPTHLDDRCITPDAAVRLRQRVEQERLTW